MAACGIVRISGLIFFTVSIFLVRSSSQNQEAIGGFIAKQRNEVSSNGTEHADLKQTLYEYFGKNVTSGLAAKDPDFFLLNGKVMKILSGSLHYFRVHPVYWRDRLRKYRAAGLNTVDVYVPWNLHEPEEGIFDFGDGSNDYSEFLNITRFLEMVREEDMFVILRPGPYICGEWEFGGLPSWLLKVHHMYVRSSFEEYQKRADNYLKRVIKEIGHLQFFTKEGPRGGPIIAVQIENEYWHFGYTNYPRDKAHLRLLKSTLETNGIESLLFTSDTPVAKDKGSIEDVFMTGNFQWNVEQNLDLMRELQPNKPLFVAEFWPGWFDHVFLPVHNVMSSKDIDEALDVMFKRDVSINFYMFHGGTNWGFLNGANVLPGFPYYGPQVTSYDYDAPLTESGKYTKKYDVLSTRIAEYDEVGNQVYIPERPEVLEATKYDDVIIMDQLRFDDVIRLVPCDKKRIYSRPVAMEKLSHLNHGNGQSYGYIVYRKEVPYLRSGNKLKIRGRIHDILTVLVNGVVINKPFVSLQGVTEFGSWALEDAEMTLNLENVTYIYGQPMVLDLMVENCGRANFGQPHELHHQLKGIWEGPVLLDGEELVDWQIIPLEFKRQWIDGLTGWKPFQSGVSLQPRLLLGHLVINDTLSSITSLDEVRHPRDTYFDFTSDETGWLHGALFVNGFNVGRYYKAGPQRSLYIPGPLLKFGHNQIVIWENYQGQEKLQFSNVPDYGPESVIQPSQHRGYDYFQFLE